MGRVWLVVIVAAAACGRIGFDARGGGSAGDDAGDGDGAVGLGLVQQAGFAASNTDPNDQFGSVIAISADGSTLAVAAEFEQSSATGINGNENDNSLFAAGAAYVFTRTGATWTQQAYIKASNTEIRDGFGFGLALSADGSTLAVGAPLEDSAATGINGNQASNATADSGAVYVFTRAGTTWTQQAYIKASNPGDSDEFGGVVALSSDGSTLAVGAMTESSSGTGVGGVHNNLAPQAGAVYVFTRAGATWSQQAYVKASNTDGADEFGFRVALSGDGSLLAVGALQEGSSGMQFDNSLMNAGAVYMFARAGATWAQTAYLKASNVDAYDNFGASVAVSADGSTLAVAATSEASAAIGVGGDQSDNSEMGAGAVYLFTHAGAAWTQQAYVKASNTAAGDTFGGGLALSADGSMMVVGAAGKDSAAGAAYVFTRSGSAWGQRAYLKASPAGMQANFGEAVTMSSDGATIAVGAFNDATRGAVYVFQ